MSPSSAGSGLKCRRLAKIGTCTRTSAERMVAKTAITDARDRSLVNPVG
jgi:hypothetical protein